MIVSEMYLGAGLGNQLWTYAVTRVIAMDKGYDFGIMSPQKFKGANIMDIDFGQPVTGGSGPEGGPPTQLPDNTTEYYKEKALMHPIFNVDVSPTDYDLLNIKDNTKIEGIMQSTLYIQHRYSEIVEWFKIKEDRKILQYSQENACVIHVRGGDFRYVKDTILPRQYFVNAINYMKSVNSGMTFVVVTDDVEYTKNILPEYDIVGASNTGVVDALKGSHHIGGPIEIDYAIINSAQNLILSNSSFGWWAAYTNTGAKTIVAPKYWSKHNMSDGFWSTGDILTDKWLYIDRDGKASSYDECQKEFEEYKTKTNLYGNTGRISH